MRDAFKLGGYFQNTDGFTEKNLFETCKITFHLSMRIHQKTDADCISRSGGDEATEEHIARVRNCPGIATFWTLF